MGKKILMIVVDKRGQRIQKTRSITCGRFLSLRAFASAEPPAKLARIKPGSRIITPWKGSYDFGMILDLIKMGTGYFWRQVQFPHSLLSPSTATFFVGTWRRRHYCHCHHHHYHDCHHHHHDDHPEAWKNKRSRKESRDGGTSDGRDEERLDQCFRLVRQICPIYFHDLSLGAVDVSYFRSSDKVCVCVCGEGG